MNWPYLMEMKRCDWCSDELGCLMCSFFPLWESHWWESLLSRWRLDGLRLPKLNYLLWCLGPPLLKIASLLRRGRLRLPKLLSTLLGCHDHVSLMSALLFWVFSSEGGIIAIKSLRWWWWWWWWCVDEGLIAHLCQAMLMYSRMML